MVVCFLFWQPATLRETAILRSHSCQVKEKPLNASNEKMVFDAVWLHKYS